MEQQVAEANRRAPAIERQAEQAMEASQELTESERSSGRQKKGSLLRRIAIRVSSGRRRAQNSDGLKSGRRGELQSP